MGCSGSLYSETCLALCQVPVTLLALVIQLQLPLDIRDRLCPRSPALAMVVQWQPIQR